MRSRLEALACPGLIQRDNIVEQQVPFVEGIVMTGKADRPAAVLGEEVGRGVRSP